MRFGCCISTTDQLAALEHTAADYAEVPAARLMGLGDDEFEAFAVRFTASRTGAHAANVFLPPDLTLVGPDTSRERQDDYVHACIGRLARLGVDVLVFGSGRARNVPEGFSRERALDQLEDFMRRAATEAGRRGVTMVLEPLQRGESNVFTTVGESAAFLRERRPGGTRLLADMYHMAADGEPFAVIDECADLLAHVHVAEAGSRRAPRADNPEVCDFLSHLYRVGFAGNCSIECGWDDFGAEVGTALDNLRQLARQAGWDA
jgi:sugar phosphate isomerase/epimerase